MASIYQRTNKDGKKVWRGVIRIKGHPPVCWHAERKQEVEDWAKDAELQIKRGKYFCNKAKEKTVANLIDYYIQEAVIGWHKAARDTVRQLNHFHTRIGDYALIYITPDLLIEERKKLLNTPTNRNKSRNPATVNRYFASLSGAFRYACKNLRWIDENPCENLLKLKAKPKERRILIENEEARLLEACRQSPSHYLYCIVLIGLTTGARKSEILNLTWDTIDFDNRIAHIKDSKNGRPRRVGLVDSVIQELKRLFSTRDIKKPLVFASKTPFGKIDIKKSWLSALNRAEIKNFVFHGLRHHFCSIGGQIGASGQQLRSQLGHATSSMTDHYTSIDAEATRFIGESIEQRLLRGKMKHNLDEACAIIVDLQQAIEFKTGCMQQESNYWLHGATDVVEASELQRWLFDNPPLSDNAKEKASKCTKYWREWLGFKDTYYVDDGKFKLIKPYRNEILYDYIFRMALLVEEKGRGERLEWRALKSFLAYMRNLPSEEIAFIEQIFPEKMDIVSDRIIRKITPEVYPISQEIARDILCELARIATNGRSNSRLSAFESLGLCWLCLTASRLRLPTYLEMIKKTKESAISIDGEYPTMLVPTLFGDRKIRISGRVAKFLIALSRIPSKKPRETILQSPKKSLIRAFDRVIQNCAVNPDLGNITYTTLLSPPHIFGKDCRHKPK